MKVSNVGASGKSQGTAKKKKAEGGHGAEFAEHLKAASENVAASEVSESAGVGSVSGILAIQEAGTATDGRSKGLAMTYGGELLDQLEVIRRDILLGAIPKDRLMNLAQRLRSAAQRSGDPKLDAILDDIEMRVEIEIAKFTR